MARPTPISGFPEWLPEQKLIEDRLIRTIREVYESFGFTPIETPAAELITTLVSKGVVDKEIYAVQRLQGEPGEEAELGLHFDLTVPFARYVAQHAPKLVFPFKRYQLQKVWRGDRPQKGRFREFYQFDIDTIARDELPLSCDAEVIAGVDRAFSKLALGDFTIRINSRRVLHGFYEALGLGPVERKAAIVAVDKLDKVGIEGIRTDLLKISGLTPEVAERITASCAWRLSPREALSKLRELPGSPDLEQGIAELETITSLLPEQTQSRIVIDMSLARGLDYYTGVIVEVGLKEYPAFGTVASGGRYDNLASDFTKEALPGVGLSIGLTRLVSLVLDNNLMETSKRTPTLALVTVYEEGARARYNALADELRDAGVPTEVYYKNVKLGKQIEYAEAKGIRYVFFVDEEGIRVKDLQTKEQIAVTSLGDWKPGAA